MRFFAFLLCSLIEKKSVVWYEPLCAPTTFSVEKINQNQIKNNLFSSLESVVISSADF